MQYVPEIMRFGWWIQSHTTEEVSFTEFYIISTSIDDFSPKEGVLRTSLWYHNYLSTEK